MTEEITTEEPLRLGGMALRNGLLIQGPTHWSAAVRDRNDEIQVGSGRRPTIAPKLAGRIPGVRGPIKLAEAMAVLPVVRRAMPAARLPFEDPRVLVAIAGTLAASGLVRRGIKSSAGREGVVHILGMVPAMVALRDRELAAYHGVEHKAIAAYEQGTEDPAGASKEHDRCGSNLIAPMIALSAAGTALIEHVMENPGGLARAGVTLGGASIAVEMFAWSDKHGETPIAQAFHTPGREIQRLVATKEPTPKQLEVGVAALAEILRAEGATT